MKFITSYYLRIALAIIVVGFLLFSGVINSPAVQATDISVKFEKIRESPVDVTFRVTINGLSGDYPANIKFEGLSTDVKITEVNNVVESQYTVQEPIYGLRDTTVQDLLNYSAETPLSKELADYLNKQSPMTKLKDIKTDLSKTAGGVEVINNIGLTITDTVGYKDVIKTRTDRNRIASFKNTDIKIFTASTSKVYEITLKTGTTINPDTGGYGSKGVLVVNINGVDYKDLTHSSWWDTNWAYRKKLTFDNSASTENLTNFTVLVTLNSTRITYSDFQALGQDARFVDADDTTSLPYEIENWNTSANSTIWVKVPQIDLGSTTDFIYMYYGNPTCADGQDIANTWDSSYIFVSHLNDNPDTSHVKDSTVTSNNGTKKAANEPIQTAGYINKAQQFDCVNDYISIPHNANQLLTSGGTILALINPYGIGESNTGGIVAKGSSITGTNGYRLGCSTNNRLAFFINAGTGIYTATNAITYGSYQEATVTFTTAGLITHYINGIQSGTPASSNASSGIIDTNPLYISNRFGSTASTFNGTIEQVFILNTVQSANWTYAQYLSMTNNFITYSSAINPPTVVTNPAYNVSATLSTLSGNITFCGGENATMEAFQWDTDSGVPYTNNTTIPIPHGVGEFSETRNLFEGELYYYRAGAQNSAGWGWGAEQLFLMKPVEPTNFTAIGTHAQVALAWTAGVGADNTTIYGRIGTYPTSRADPLATLVYSNIGTNTTHVGLTDGDHWYYRAWSYCTEGGLEQYSDLYAQADATPNLLPPTNFTAIDMGSSSANLTWTMGFSANNTLIRVSRTSYPASITDGEFVYFGDGTHTIDIGLSLETTTYYYSAWSENSGDYSLTYATASVGGKSMVLFGFIGLGGILIFATIKTRNILFSLATSIVFIFLLFYTRANPIAGVTVGSTVDTIWIGICVAVFCGVPFMTWRFRNKDRARMGYEKNQSEDGESFIQPMSESERTFEAQGRSLSSRHGTSGRYADSADEYQAKIHGILHPRNRRRR